MPAALYSGSEVIAVSDRSAPTTPITCGSRITFSAARAATTAGVSAPGDPSSIETKLIPSLPIRPPACAIASFCASTMSRPTPVAGSGSDEYSVTLSPTTRPPASIAPRSEPHPASTARAASAASRRISGGASSHTT